MSISACNCLLFTADCLARRGLDNTDHCLLCEQQEEIVQHNSVSCIFSREVWDRVLLLVGLQQCAPEPNDEVFQDWWHNTEFKAPKQPRKGFNFLVILVTWWLWKHCTACVFNRVSPSAQRILQDIKDDAEMWYMDGAKELASLWV